MDQKGEGGEGDESILVWIPTLRRQRRQQAQAANQSQNHWTGTLKAPARAAGPNESVYLVVRRKPLNELPRLWRWLIRAVYFRTGWASDYSVEYQGVYIAESAARYAAGETGLSYTEVPLNDCLPIETCQNGTHDFPHSEASHRYRRRKLPVVAIARRDLEALEARLNVLYERMVST